ncbi:MAG: hypothetical protein ACFFCS_04330 [Candidatus Hodarchaeota archaeon]
MKIGLIAVSIAILFLPFSAVTADQSGIQPNQGSGSIPPFDGMYYNYTFTTNASGLPSNSSASDTFIPHSSESDLFVVTSYIAERNVNETDRVISQSLSSDIGDGTHEWTWIPADSEMNGQVLIAVRNSTDQAFQVSGNATFQYGGRTYNCWKLNSSEGSIAYYEKSSGLLVNATFLYENASIPCQDIIVLVVTNVGMDPIDEGGFLEEIILIVVISIGAIITAIILSKYIRKRSDTSTSIVTEVPAKVVEDEKPDLVLTGGGRRRGSSVVEDISPTIEIEESSPKLDDTGPLKPPSPRGATDENLKGMSTPPEGIDENPEGMGGSRPVFEGHRGGGTGKVDIKDLDTVEPAGHETPDAPPSIATKPPSVQEVSSQGMSTPVKGALDENPKGMEGSRPENKMTGGSRRRGDVIEDDLSLTKEIDKSAPKIGDTKPLKPQPPRGATDEGTKGMSTSSKMVADGKVSGRRLEGNLEPMEEWGDGPQIPKELASGDPNSKKIMSPGRPSSDDEK